MTLVARHRGRGARRDRAGTAGPGRGDAAGREDRLATLLERAAGSRPAFGERWLFAAGGALVAAGLVAVVIGWVGASRTVLVAGQIPYLISGGLLGLGLVFLGSFLYFGHWLAVLVRESRERGRADREDMELLAAALRDVHGSLRALAPPAPAGATIPDGASAPVAGEARPGPLPEGELVVTTTGTMAHRPGCRAVAGRPNVRPVAAVEGLKLCGMCHPAPGAGWR